MVLAATSGCDRDYAKISERNYAKSFAAHGATTACDSAPNREESRNMRERIFFFFFFFVAARRTRGARETVRKTCPKLARPCTVPSGSFVGNTRPRISRTRSTRRKKRTSPSNSRGEDRPSVKNRLNFSRYKKKEREKSFPGANVLLWGYSLSKRNRLDLAATIPV